MVRYHICFYGQVQNVGFRYRAMQLANPLGLTGWVKNVEDYVEMEVQGPEAVIRQLIDSLQEDAWIGIDDIHMDTIPLKEEKKFSLAW